MKRWAESYGDMATASRGARAITELATFDDALQGSDTGVRFLHSGDLVYANVVRVGVY